MSLAFNLASAISASWRSVLADSFKTRAFSPARGRFSLHSNSRAPRRTWDQDRVGYQRVARVEKSGARAGYPGPGGRLPVVALAADFHQLADGGDGIVIAFPKTVSQRRATLSVANFGGG